MYAWSVESVVPKKNEKRKQKKKLEQETLRKGRTLATDRIQLEKIGFAQGKLGSNPAET
jgi:hypothetical protein